MQRAQVLLAATIMTGATTGAADAASVAQNSPARPVRLVVGFPPGGGTDIMARIIAPKLIKAWGQQVVIDNRIGATGTIGATLVARVNPDGYTLLMGHLSSNAIAPSLFKVPYDPARDFAPITVVGSVPHVLVVHPSVEAKTVKELIALTKAQPGGSNSRLRATAPRRISPARSSSS